MSPEHLAVDDFDLNITPAAIDRFNMIINERHLIKDTTLIRVYKRDDQCLIGLDQVSDGIKHVFDQIKRVDDDLHLVVHESYIEEFLGKTIDYDHGGDVFTLG